MKKLVLRSKRKKSDQRGSTLPVILIVATAVMIIASAVLSNSIAISQSLRSQYYNRMAKTASESGIAYAQNCITAGVTTWTVLRPQNNCDGTGTVGSAYIEQLGPWRSRFEVSALDTRADGAKIITAKGIVEYGQASSPSRLYSQTDKQIVSGSVVQLTGQRTFEDSRQCLNKTMVIASNSQVYGAGGGANGALGSGTSASSNTTPVKFNLPAGKSVKKAYCSLDAGNSVYVLTTDNTVYGAGLNTNGQLGNGATSSQSTPVGFTPPSGLSIVDFAPGHSTAFILASDGQVYGVGLNTSGRLGNGTTTNATTPVKFILPAGLTAKAIYPQIGSTFVLASDNQLYGAGSNTGGVLGDGTTTARSTPVKFNLATNCGASCTVKEVSDSKANRQYVIASDNQVYGGSSTPAKFSLTAGLTAKKVTVGGTITVVLASDNKIYHSSGSFPANMGISSSLTVRDVVTVGTTTTMLASDNQVYSIGYNGYGQFGDGTTTNNYTNAVVFPLPSSVTAQRFVVQTNNVYVYASDGNIYTTGWNASGQRGYGSTSATTTPTVFNIGYAPASGRMPVRPDLFKYFGDDEGIFQSPNVQMYHNMAFIGMDNNVYGAGWNNYGQLGNGNTSSQNTPVRFNLPTGLTAIKLVVSENIIFVIASDNQVYGAGRNEFGQLGDGTTTNRSTPVKFNLPAGLTAKMITTNSLSTYVLASDNVVYAVGENTNGQLGNGGTTNSTATVVFGVPSGTTVRTITAQAFSTDKAACAVASDNQMYCAGVNSNGRFGTGSTAASVSTPVKFNLPAGLTVRQVANRADNCFYVLASNNQVYWSGGDGVATTISTPAIMSLTAGLTAVNVSADTYNAFILASDGQVYGRGANSDGQLGNGTTTSSGSTVKFNIPSGETAVKVMHTYATCHVLTASGKVYGAGDNIYGMVGNGTTTDVSTPALVTMPSGVVATDMIGEAFNTYIIGSDNKVYGIGYNGYGALGDTTYTSPRTTASSSQFTFPLIVTNAYVF
jgi:alpha-tubulin suppressor-like RCC1 family protein